MTRTTIRTALVIVVLALLTGAGILIARSEPDPPSVTVATALQPQEMPSTKRAPEPQGHSEPQRQPEPADNPLGETLAEAAAVMEALALPEQAIQAPEAPTAEAPPSIPSVEPEPETPTSTPPAGDSPPPDSVEEPEFDHIPVADEQPIREWAPSTGERQAPTSPNQTMELLLEPIAKPEVQAAEHQIAIPVITAELLPSQQAGGAGVGVGDAFDSGGGCANQCIVGGSVRPTSGRSAEVTIKTDTDAEIGLQFEATYYTADNDQGREAIFHLVDLEPGRTYYLTAVASDAYGHQAQAMGSFTMPQRKAYVRFLYADILDDGDPGANRGEISFWVGVNGENLGQTSEQKVRSGDTLDFGPSLVTWVDPAGSRLELNANGYERDSGHFESWYSTASIDLDTIAEQAAASPLPSEFDGYAVLESLETWMAYRVYVGINVWYE